MKRSGLMASLGAILVLATTWVADAQPATPDVGSTTNKPAATASEKAPQKGDNASNKPKADATTSPGRVDGGSAMPPGHPPVDKGLPQGHPSVQEGMPQGHPPIDAEEDESRGTMPPVFQPPEDTADDDPSLAPGVVVVRIQDALGQAIAGAKIRLSILHNTVAKGESEELLIRDADETGSFKFENLPIGSGTTFRVSTELEKATFSIHPFSLGDRAGKRAILHAYPATANLDDLLVLMSAFVYVQLRQDTIGVEQVFTIGNLSPVAWLPDVTISLPTGFKALNTSDSPDEMKVQEVKDEGVALRGTINPGRHQAMFRYTVPWAQNERESLRIDLPPNVVQVQVIAEASKTMGLEVKGFPTSKRMDRGGKKVLVTEYNVMRERARVPETLDIMLSGLPTPSKSRWFALGIAIVTVIGAVLYTVQRREDETKVDDDTRKELVEAREALLAEFVALERAHKKGDVGPKTYARVRAALLDALARIVRMIEK